MMRLFTALCCLVSASSAYGIYDLALPVEREPHPIPSHRYQLVEEFTAATLVAGEIKLGTDFEIGLTDRFMLGTDLVSGVVGVPSLQAKVKILEHEGHHVALGLRAAYLNKKTLLWGNANEHFTKLDARVMRPSLSWSNAVSSRLTLHTFWAKGFGPIKAQLSEKGRRKLWETKHPGKDYETRHAVTQIPQNDSREPEHAAAVSTSENQEKGEQSSLTQQSIQVQSITGLAQDRFQLTGEYTRLNGNKILITSRMEQTIFEKLRSNFLRLTLAHQWVWPNFQTRLGIGMQYFVMSGRDLDGEQIDSAGLQPASDIAFYWRF